MYFIATDILTDLCGLSLGLIITLIPAGALLWLLGWWSHRFWIVLTSTVIAGVVCLMEANSLQAQPIVIAVLAAIAAGVLALALVRLVTFAAGGVAGVYLMVFAIPSFQHQAIAFFISGLVCLLLFRWFFMAVTSLTGALFLTYGALALLHYHEHLDAIAWSDDNATLLSILVGGGALFGLAFQFFFDRWRKKKLKEKNEPGDEDMISLLISKLGLKGSK